MKVEYYKDTKAENLYIRTSEGVIQIGCSHKSPEAIMNLQREIAEEGGRICVTKGKRCNSTVLNKCVKIGEFEYAR